jgi:PBP1b-binding outer membrane lipoprotein LpoB
MKKKLLSAVALTALVLGGCSSMGGKGHISLTPKCEEHCTQQGKRVDFQYSEETGACQCSAATRNA